MTRSRSLIAKFPERLFHPHMRMNRDYAVVAIGRAYVDELALHIGAEFLRAHEIPLAGGRLCDIGEIESIYASVGVSKKRAGGSTANSLATIAAMGGSVGYFGKVGTDDRGAFFQEDSRKRSIPILCDPVTGGQTAWCLVFCSPAPTHERSFAYYNGCSAKFTRKDFQTLELVKTRFLLIEALLLQDPLSRSLLLELIATAKDKCAIAISLHGTNNWLSLAEIAGYVARAADVICGNKYEQAAFQNATLRRPEKPKKDQIIITTLGREGANLRVRATTMWADKIAVDEARIVNTVGAGDAFLGGFLFAASQGRSLSECLTAANLGVAQVLVSISGRPEPNNSRPSENLTGP